MALLMASTPDHSRAAHFAGPLDQHRLLQGGHVLVAAAREADNDVFAFVARRPAAGAIQGMRALDRRENAFGTAAVLQGLQRLVITGGHISDPSGRQQQRVLGSDTGIVEPCGNGMRLLDLAVLILQ